MKLTDALKQYLRETFGVPADASDEQYRKALGDKIASGEISSEKLSELISEKAPDPRQMLGEVFAQALAPLADQMKTLTAAVAGSAGKASSEPPPAKETADNSNLLAEIDKRVEATIANVRKDLETAGAKTKPQNPMGAFNRAAYAEWVGNPDVKVCNAIDSYSKSRSNLYHGSDSKHADLRGLPVKLGEKALETCSKADYAVIGAFLKWQFALRAPNGLQPHMTDHDWDVLKYAIHELPWSGSMDKGRSWIDDRKLNAQEKASLIADTTTGGGYTVPAIVESAIIQTPLLYGELFPRVTLINVASGNQFLTQTIGNVTFTEGANAVEGTGTIPLTDCTDLINQITVDIENAVGSMEVGLDLLEDSISNLGAEIAGVWGRASMKLLDDWIVSGNGTTAPLGVFNTSGMNNIPSVNAGGTITLGDAENLAFGISKAFRQQRGGRMCYIGTDANFARFKAIPVAGGWNQRVLGMDYKNYDVIGYPWAVTTSSDIDNSSVAFANMGYYQMWRRLGMSFRVETGGATLARSNTALFVARMRFGGRMMLAGAACIIDDLPE